MSTWPSMLIHVKLAGLTSLKTCLVWYCLGIRCQSSSLFQSNPLLNYNSISTEPLKTYSHNTQCLFCRLWDPWEFCWKFIPSRVALQPFQRSCDQDGRIPQSTVSLNTPIRLWGRSWSSRAPPALDPAPRRARGRSSAQVKVLRSPQLCRCSNPGLFLRGRVWEEEPACGGVGPSLGRSGGWLAGETVSDPVITCRRVPTNRINNLNIKPAP